MSKSAFAMNLHRSGDQKILTSDRLILAHEVAHELVHDAAHEPYLAHE